MGQKKLFDIIIATGFGSGFVPVGPGTAGALLATLIWLGAFFAGLSFTMLLVSTTVAIVVFTLLGVKAANVLEPEWGEDPSRIVVDEMVGVWIPLLAINSDKHVVLYALAAFALFRFFDILKPLGIRKMESVGGGWGVMLDDILAGVYSFIVLKGIIWLIG
ncbi:MAG: phosphatidylglycerophosphatase A [Bacteroidales bacterium 45-6]|nr:MAG: phosphatidylglycerophosphatase A [Bacteroidales bacterium 45-6]